MTGDSKKKKFIVIAIVLVLAIIGLVVFLVFRKSIKATTMRILRLEGTVSLQDDSGMKSVKENLRLVSGNVLDTSADSLVSIGLDDVKIVTLDELSRAKFNQSGKYLNLDLTKGSLFFEVDKPLADDETFEIETSTMIVGIRGTSGWVSVEGEHESLIITDGHVHVIGTNPVTGEVKEVEVSAGQRLVVYLYNDREVDSIMFELEEITEHDLPEFVIKMLRSNSDLLDRVVAATDWDREYILGVSDEDIEPDDEPEGTQVADTNPSEPEPVTEPDDEPDPVDVGGNDGNDQPADNLGGGNNNDNTVADNGNNLTTAPVTQTEMQRQITAAKAQVVSENMDGTYTLADGTVFDPDYYGNRYPDVVEQYGSDSDALLAHYVSNGKAEGRYASNDEEQAAELAEDIARLEAQRIAEQNSQQNQNSVQTTNQNTSQNTNQNQQTNTTNVATATTGALTSGNDINLLGDSGSDVNVGTYVATNTPPYMFQTANETRSTGNGTEEWLVLPASMNDSNGQQKTDYTLQNMNFNNAYINVVDASAITDTYNAVVYFQSTYSGTDISMITSNGKVEYIGYEQHVTVNVGDALGFVDLKNYQGTYTMVELTYDDLTIDWAPNGGATPYTVHYVDAGGNQITANNVSYVDISPINGGSGGYEVTYIDASGNITIGRIDDTNGFVGN